MPNPFGSAVVRAAKKHAKEWVIPTVESALKRASEETGKAYIKPQTKLNKTAWKALLRRTMKREGSLTKARAEEFMNRMGFEPPTKEYSQLVPMGMEEGLRQKNPALAEAMGKEVMTEPYQGAKNLMKEYPGSFVRMPPEPDVIRMGVNPAPRFGPPVMAGEDIAAGVSLEKMKFRMPPSSKSAASMAQADAIKDMRAEGILPAGPAPEVSEAARALAKMAAEGEVLWRDGGGLRTVMGKTWETLWERGPAWTRAYHSPKEYFIASYIKFKKDPKALAKRSPREYKLLQRITGELVD